MSKNLSDIFPPTEIGGGGGGGIEEAPRDGRMYARQEQQNTGMGWTAFDPGNLDPGTEDDQVLLWHTLDDKWSASNTVPAVQTGPVAPFNPVEGTLWMEVPNQGDATMWIYTKDSGGNGRWLQHPGGKDGAPGADGNIADATTEGVVATWDNTAGQWTPEPKQTIHVSSGKVVLGPVDADSSAVGPSALVVSGNSNAGITVASPGNNSFVYLGKTGTTAVDGRIAYYNNTKEMKFATDGTDRLTIDSTGDATFSGTVNVNEIKGEGDKAGFLFDGAKRIIPTENGSPSNGKQDFGTVNNKFKDAYFSGTVNAGALTSTGTVNASNGAFSRPSYGGIQFTQGDANGPLYLLPRSSTDFSNGVTNIGANSNRFASCYLTGSVVSTRHGVSIGTRDLIETLHTLREATKDETTIKGLRDAIGNAVGGLIEKFEAIQAETQEIDDE